MRAGLVKWAWEWPWSSAAGHVSGKGDALVRPGGPLLEEVSDWRRFLAGEDDEKSLAALRGHLRTGRPLGSEDFVSALERATGRILRPLRPGPKPGPKHKRR